MAGIDWLTALAQADQSLEGTLARRDVSRLQQMLAGLSQEAEGRRQFGEEMELKRKALGEQTALRIEQQRMREQIQEQALREREIDNERQRAFGIHRTLQPGGSISSSELPLMQKFGLDKDFTPDETDPLRSVYQAEQYKRKLAEAESQQRMRDAQEKRAERDQQLQEQANQRAARAEQRADQAANRSQQRLDLAVKKANEMRESIKGFPFSMAVQSRADELLAEAESSPFNIFSWFSKDAPPELNSAQAYAQAYKEITEEARKQGLFKGPTVAPLIQEPANKASQETPEQRRNRLLKEIK